MPLLMGCDTNIEKLPVGSKGPAGLKGITGPKGRPGQKGDAGSDGDDGGSKVDVIFGQRGEPYVIVGGGTLSGDGMTGFTPVGCYIFPGMDIESNLSSGIDVGTRINFASPLSGSSSGDIDLRLVVEDLTNSTTVINTVFNIVKTSSTGVQTEVLNLPAASLANLPSGFAVFRLKAQVSAINYSAGITCRIGSLQMY